MQYELTEKEIQHIEAYRDLLEEYQKAADEQIKVLFDLQTRVFKELMGIQK